MNEPTRSLTAWLSDRIGWAGIASALDRHRVPKQSFLFYLGVLTLFLLVIQVLTGVLLVLHYHADATQAHASVERIVTEVPYGDLIRGVHAWSSDLFVACLLAHLFTVVVRRSYKPPHELTWLSGLVALVVGLGLAFTGLILPWTQHAYAQARVGSELGRNIPFIGAWLVRFLRGGDEVTSNTLAHAYGFHVAALPALATLVVFGHLFFLARKPAATADSESETIPVFPDFFARQALACTGVWLLIMTLAIFFERHLGDPADPRVASTGAHPPWYFSWIHQIIRVSPRQLLGVEGARFLVGAASLVALLVAALPFIDRRGSKLVAWIAWGALILVLLLAASALT